MDVPEVKRPLLGIVPIGSGNDSAQSTAVPHEPDLALVHALHAQLYPVDLGLFSDANGRQV